MLDTWFSRIKVLRALEQETGVARQRRASGAGISEMSIYFTEALAQWGWGDVVLVIVLGCLLCCSDQWSEAGEGLGNLQEMMLKRRKRTKDTWQFTILPQQPLQDVKGIHVCTRCCLESFRSSSPNWRTSLKDNISFWRTVWQYVPTAKYTSIPAIPLLDIFPREMSLWIHQKTHTKMLIEALLMTVINEKNPNVQDNGRMNNIIFINYYTKIRAIKKNK